MAKVHEIAGIYFHTIDVHFPSSVKRINNSMHKFNTRTAPVMPVERQIERGISNGKRTLSWGFLLRVNMKFWTEMVIRRVAVLVARLLIKIHFISVEIE